MNKSIYGWKFQWRAAKRGRRISFCLAACLLPLAAFGQFAVQVTGAQVTEVGIYASHVVFESTWSNYSVTLTNAATTCGRQFAARNRLKCQ